MIQHIGTRWLAILTLLLATNINYLHAQEATPDRQPYDDVVEFLTRVQKENAQNAELFELGLSDSGKMIIGLKVGKGELNHLVVATHHGNEYGSTAVAQAFAEDVAKNPIPNTTVYVIPVLNISGYNKGQRWETVDGRYYDPNRDYPGPCGTDGPFNLKSTKALADFLVKTPIVSSATLHTFYPGVLYPWGISTDDLETPYNDLFIQLGNEATSLSGYTVGNSTAELYPADGTFEDYAYWKHGIWSLLFEMGFSHSPSPSAVSEMIRVNVPGLRKMFEASPNLTAQNHQFEGHCNGRALYLDRRDE